MTYDSSVDDSSVDLGYMCDADAYQDSRQRIEGLGKPLPTTNVPFSHYFSKEPRVIILSEQDKPSDTSDFLDDSLGRNCMWFPYLRR